jgi:hypothetical protein
MTDCSIRVNQRTEACTITALPMTAGVSPTATADDGRARSQSRPAARLVARQPTATRDARRATNIRISWQARVRPGAGASPRM